MSYRESKKKMTAAISTIARKTSRQSASCSTKVEKLAATISGSNPRPGRDLRLDLFRGLANWAIFLDHIPNNAVAWLTARNYGFSDAADLFVFISGYTAALAYSRVMRREGFLAAAVKLMRRVWYDHLQFCAAPACAGR